MRTCPDELTLSLLLEGDIESPRYADLVRHIDECPACQGALDRLTRSAVEKTLNFKLLWPRRTADGLPDWADAVLDRVARRPPAREQFECGSARTSSGGPRVAGYEILGELGRGATAVVYRARHLGLRREVALKMLHAAQRDSGELRKRLRQEARALASLQHPNIVRVYDIGEQDGHPFFSLELVRGTTLARWMSGAPQPPRVAAELIQTLAVAVDYAHRNGILHRDLKPSNVLIELPPNGPPARVPIPPIKVSDFGLAKVVIESDTLHAPRTESGAILGTPSYMAPEQADLSVDRVGPAADVYALGAILYELLTGRPPFRADTPLNTLLRVVRDDPVPVSRLRPRVPSDLATVCMKCLEKEPGRRYPTAAGLADDLRRFLDGESVLARPVGVLGRFRRWTRRKPSLAAMLFATVGVVVVAFAVVLWQWQEADVARGRAEGLAATEAAARADSQEQEARATRARRDVERLAAELLLDQGLELCERGDVGPGLGALARGLERASAAGLDDLVPAFRLNLACWAERLAVPDVSPPLGRVSVVAFSKDLKRALVAAFAPPHPAPPGRLSTKAQLEVPPGAPAAIRIWDTDTWKSVELKLHPLEHLDAVALSPDGSRLLTGGRGGRVQLWDAETGRPIGPTLHGHGDVYQVAFSPDGRTVAAVVATPDQKHEVRLWATDTQKETCPTLPCSSFVTCIVFSPDGKTLLAAQGFQGKVSLWDLVTGKPRGWNFETGKPTDWDFETGKPTNWEVRHSAVVWGAAFSPDGTCVATGGADRLVKVWRPNGIPDREPFVHPYPVRAVAFSADGKSILSSCYSNFSRSRSAHRLDEGVWLWDVETGKSLLGPLAPCPAQFVAISPNGQRVLTAGADERIQSWTLRDVRPVECNIPFIPDAMAFGPGGRLVAAGCVWSDRLVRRIEIRDAATGKRTGTAQENVDVKNVEWGHVVLAPAPDGRTFASGADGLVQFWDADTGRSAVPPLRVSSEIGELAFSRDGQRLLVSPSAERPNALRGDDVTAPCQLWDWRKGQRLWDSSRTGARVSVLSPDGRHVLTGGSDGVGRLFDVATGESRTLFSHGPGPIRVLVFSPDGKAVLAGCGDSARLWDAATGLPLGPPLLHGGQTVRTAGFLDGSRVFTAAAPVEDGAVADPFGPGVGGSVRIWDAVTGRPLSQLPHRAAITAVRYHPGTGLFATASENCVRLWDSHSGRPVGPRLWCGVHAFAVAFAPNGRSVAAAGPRLLRVWAVPEPAEGPPEEVARRVRELHVSRPVALHPLMFH